MKQVDEIGFKDILELIMHYQAFTYMFKHSILNTSEFRNSVKLDEGEEYDQLIQSFDAVLLAEDSILDTNWLFTEMQEDL